MTPKRRIDFALFPEVRKEHVSSGMISGPLKEVLSDDRSLQSVLKLIEPDVLIHWVTYGDWAMHELLLGILKHYRSFKSAYKQFCFK